METGYQSRLVREVAELVQLLQQEVTNGDSVLDELTESAVKSVPGARYAGITVADRDGSVQTASSTGRYPTLLDKIQQTHGEGPCLSAAWEQHVIRIDDVALDERWPAYCRDAVEQTPIRSIMSFQLFADHRMMGALNFYAEQPDVFDDDAVELGLIFATHTALAWKLLRREEQFRSALASRDIIGQAKGMIMERFKIDAVQAFELLKRLSQNSNTPVTTVARQLVEAGRTNR
ncbi:MAG TPA: GAF and ANTAR domain-containing protein [Mycobacterium sp.]|nr:GAF and ANTAR domain-containing protein [Mycobacterium sp.]